MHYRLSGWCAFASWLSVHVQVSAQLQTSPHWHVASDGAAGR
ncbi:MAG TPA: hypothetical protein VM032_01665 [Vicinamibacterales bacterium]|nr:hypothetical protein [Vicinamibacterales bacterium]